MKTILRIFLPHPTTATFTEKLRSGLAGGIAILWLGMLIEFLPHGPFPVLMLASVGASAALLFATPHSPMAQPWNLLVGQLISAASGWVIGLLIHDMVIAAAMAVGLAIFLMHLLDALHPPGAATALLLTLAGSQFHHMGLAWVTIIICLNVVTLLLLALLINNLLPGRRYPAPYHPHLAQEVVHTSNMAVTEQDIRDALAEMDSVIDVSEDDLIDIYDRAIRHARDRR